MNSLIKRPREVEYDTPFVKCLLGLLVILSEQSGDGNGSDM